MILPENRFPVFGIMRHCHARPGAKPLEPFGKGSNALKAGTPDAGPESPTVQKRGPRGRPFSPRPGVERKRALYAAYLERQGRTRQRPAEQARAALLLGGGPWSPWHQWLGGIFRACLARVV